MFRVAAEITVFSVMVGGNTVFPKETTFFPSTVWGIFYMLSYGFKLPIFPIVPHCFVTSVYFQDCRGSCSPWICKYAPSIQFLTPGKRIQIPKERKHVEALGSQCWGFDRQFFWIFLVPHQNSTLHGSGSVFSNTVGWKKCLSCTTRIYPVLARIYPVLNPYFSEPQERPLY